MSVDLQESDGALYDSGEDNRQDDLPQIFPTTRDDGRAAFQVGVFQCFVVYVLSVCPVWVFLLRNFRSRGKIGPCFVKVGGGGWFFRQEHFLEGVETVGYQKFFSRK